MAVERVVHLHLAITVLKEEEAAVQVGIATRAEAVGVEAPEVVTTVAVLHVKEVASTLGRDRPVLAATAVTTTPTPAVETAVMWIGGEKVKRKKSARITHITARV